MRTKGLVLLACVAALGSSAVGCNQPPQPGVKKSTPVPAATPASTEEALFRDPATAMAVVAGAVDVAVKLKSLFGPKDTPVRDLRGQLGQIQAQNAQTIAMLGRVLDILDSMGVLVQRSVRDELQTHIRTTLSSNLQVFYETWASELDDRRAGAQAQRRYERDILPVIRPLTRQLADPVTYGYGHFDAVGQGMLVETWISRRLGERSAFRRQSGGFYAGYFGGVLDPQAAGSLGQQLRLKREQKARLKAILNAADAAVAAGVSETTTEEVTREPCRGGHRTQSANITRAVQGSQSTGYSVAETSRFLNPVREDCIPRGGDGPSGPGGKLDALVPQSEDPLDNQSSAPAGRAAYWNSVRTVHQQVSNDEALLARSAESAAIYLAEARRAATNG